VSTFIGMLAVHHVTNSSPYASDAWLAVTADERRTKFPSSGGQSFENSFSCNSWIDVIKSSGHCEVS